MYKKISELLPRIGEKEIHLKLAGLPESFQAFLLASLIRLNHRQLLIIVPQIGRAQTLRNDISLFLDLWPLWEGENYGKSLPEKEILVFPPWDISPYEPVSPDDEIVGQRLETLESLRGNLPVSVITTMEAIYQRVLPREELAKSVLNITVGQELPFESVINRLLLGNYKEAEMVEERGSFARRGGLIDLFPPHLPFPIRLEFFGDQIESIRQFDPDSQLSFSTLAEINIIPFREVLFYQEKIAELGSRLTNSAEKLSYSPKKVQLLMEDLENFGHFPGQEWLAPFFYPKMESFLDYIPINMVIFLDDPDQLTQRRDELMDQVKAGYQKALAQKQVVPKPEEIYLESWEWEMSSEIWNRVVLDFFDNPEQITIQKELSPRLISPFRDKLDLFASQIDDWLKHHFRIFLVSPSYHQAEAVKKLLAQYDLGALICLPKTGETVKQDEASSSLVIFIGELSSSFSLPELGVIFLTQSDFLPVKKSKTQSAKPSRRSLHTELRDLKSGDYVVHVNYGIGRYYGLTRLDLTPPSLANSSDNFEDEEAEIWRGMGVTTKRADGSGGLLTSPRRAGAGPEDNRTQKQDNGNNSEFLLIEYADQEKLYLPVYNIGLVQKYIGSGAVAPKLDKLGGSAWKKTKGKVKESLLAMASELVKIYAAREIAPGIAFTSDNPWMHEFEEQFPFQETPDQLTAISDVVNDMETPRPMDRLICGDVGYGKTEVAMRAAFKAVLCSKQVAVLVPTTILAYQHLQTFTQRFSSYPVTIEMLSRFKTKKQQTEIIERLKEGKVDIVIGTHRLLQADIQFKDLGLLIVDEEQRFGVKHKEKLKSLRTNIDILTLTATPIPRTLHMSLLRVKDLSIIETPPRNRQAIKTYMLKFSPESIKEAIQSEIDREGQVFFVHNRVENIHVIHNFLKRIVPRARIGIAHGQMGERELEDVMVRFVKKELDVLLCTTIIESGLDIPSANTIIINRADKFGLAQLYQLRGRVGRDRYRAYAYLMVPAEELLTHEARLRLLAIRELSELGSGYLLATRDMEIRGAGNIVGKEQSGHIAAVGFELYCQLVEEAVKELKGEQESEQLETTINLGITGHIPSFYVSSVNQRLECYQKLSLLQGAGDLEAFKAELKDRYGHLPPETERLMKIVELKLMAKPLKIEKIEKAPGGLSFVFHASTSLSPERIFQSKDLPKFKFLSESALWFSRKGQDEVNIYNETKKILQKLLKLSSIQAI